MGRLSQASNLLLKDWMQIYAPLNSEPIPQLQKVEVSTSLQIPTLQIIGLPAPEVLEAKERIRSAFQAAEVDFPKKKVVLNLSPASVRKRGTGIDLAMALGILARKDRRDIHLGAWGELGLDGSIKPAGQLVRTLYASWMGKLRYLVISDEDLEAAVEARDWIKRSKLFENDPPQIVAVQNLKQILEIFFSGKKGEPQEEDQNRSLKTSTGAQDPTHAAKKASKLVASASELFPLTPAFERILGAILAGKHHSLFLGPRGVGKSEILKWMTALFPEAGFREQLEQKLISELAHGDTCTVRRVSAYVRPPALIGSLTAQTIRPGEFSLAHGGLILADEFPEWARDSREALREPLERGKVRLTRVQGSVELSANFQFVATGNLCACGGWPWSPSDSEEDQSDSDFQRKLSRCKCSPSARRSYLSRLSGPVLDRIDFIVTSTSLKMSELSVSRVHAQQELLREQILKAEGLLTETWGKTSRFLTGPEIESILEKLASWKEVVSQLKFVSLRSRHKIARNALTLAAWDGQCEPKVSHFFEAYQFRPERFSFLEETA